MRKILEIDPKAKIARVEPGVICDELAKATKPFSLTWGPKPATHSRCGFGGMISNNCGGMNAHYAGIAVHNVEALDVVLYDGRLPEASTSRVRLQFGRAASESGRSFQSRARSSELAH
jgi:FAD/FMN-containing dehydrogenase